jgi:hypothetical protein
MAVLVRDSVQVDTNIFTKSMNMVVNSVMQMLIEIAYQRRLDPSSLLAIRKSLEDSLYVWLHERTIKGLLLEISLPESANALENWELVFAYQDDPDSQVKRAPTEELKRFSETLKTLPPGSAYRIMVSLTPDAKQLEGWTQVTCKNINPTVEKDFGNFGYGNIAGQMRYTSGTW